MRLIYWVAAGSFVGSIAGLISALFLTGVASFGIQRADSVMIDDWFSDWTIGTEGSSRYLKAWIARNGLLAMRKSEAIYFVRTTDDTGQSLRETCRYLVSGGDLPAAWWSITLYDASGYLPMNTDAHLSFDASDRSETVWSFEVAKSEPVGGIAWVSSKASERFDLTLRLYLPDPEFLADPQNKNAFPTVKRLSCSAQEKS